MKKMFFLALLLLPAGVSAQVTINEIAWMGTDVSASDEWIELYNSSQEEIDLTSWRLEALDGSPSITLEGVISAESFFLLERTDDDTIPDITANQVYTGALGNTGENLILYDTENNIVDEVESIEGWLAGDNTTKQTMERVNETSWATSLEPLGTPKETNSQTEVTDPKPEENESPSADAPGQQKVKKGDIIFTEVFPNPAGIDIEREAFVPQANFGSGKVL